MASAIVRRYRDVLVKMGFRPEFSEDGRNAAIGFEHEGRRFALSIDLDDPEFFFLMSIHGLGAEGLDEAGTAIRARDVNSMLKGVKVVPVPEDALVRFSVEMFLAKVPPTPDMVGRAVAVLQLAAHEFFRGMSPAAILKASRRSRTPGKRAPRRGSSAKALRPG